MNKKELKILTRMKNRAGDAMLDILDLEKAHKWEMHENLNFQTHYDRAKYYVDMLYYHLYHMVEECQEKNTEQAAASADSA